MQWFILVSLYSLVCMSFLSPVPHCFDYCSHVVTFEIRNLF